MMSILFNILLSFFIGVIILGIAISVSGIIIYEIYLTFKEKMINITKYKNKENVIPVTLKESIDDEIINNLLASEDFIRMKKIQSAVDAYFNSLEYVKYNIGPLDVDFFCKELEMNEEDIAKVHRLIKERIIDIRKKSIDEDFN